MQSNPDPEPKVQDPLVTHSLQEAKWIVAIWITAFLWVVGYCCLFGYYREGEAITTVCGMPSWVFWGVALPWVIATLVTSWFALRCIADQPLVEHANQESVDDE